MSEVFQSVFKKSLTHHSLVPRLVFLKRSHINVPMSDSLSVVLQGRRQGGGGGL